MGNKKWLILGIALVVIIAGLGIIFFASNKVGDKSSKSASDEGQVAGASTENKTPAFKEALAKDLKVKGMILYGAYWCPHCKDQKALFGDAAQFLDYVECDAKGPNANPDECVARGIEGYPTWIYQGQKYSGTQSLEKLAEIVGFKE